MRAICCEDDSKPCICIMTGVRVGMDWVEQGFCSQFLFDILLSFGICMARDDRQD